ncbi:MAG: DUF2157 domain-containing protein [Flavipsychrobacter sp.]|nr:DUF2157 domain-containing protein [Flavipsychrobacter sp.]
MEVDKNDWTTLNNAISEWEREGKIDRTQAEELRNSLQVKNQDAGQVAQYFFLVALSCMLLAFGALFIDDKLLERFRKYFSLSHYIIALLAAGVSLAWLWYVRRKRSALSNTAYELYLVVGALTSLVSLTYLCKGIGFGGNYSGFLALAAALLFALSVRFSARFLWVGGVLALMGFYGAVTQFASGGSGLFLGMNYPIRFAAFGLLVICLSLVQRKWYAATYRITYIAGMLIFFTGMWGASVFGNYTNWTAWEAARQTQVIGYGIAFGLSAGTAFYLGVRYGDQAARDMGVLFLLANLYTRYFEFFWDSMNKGLFFLVLAVSFYAVGRWLEKRNRDVKALRDGPGRQGSV